MSAAPRVDPEFKALLPELTPDQRAGLEKAILAEGVLTPLVLWEEEGLLLDGHNRLEIAQREGIPFATRVVKLASRDAAVEWIFANQRDRRNLTPDQLALVRGRWYERRKVPGGPAHVGHPAGQKDLRVGAGREGTAAVLAKEFGVSPRVIRRDAKFAAAVETLKVVDPEIEQKVVTGKGPTRKAVIAAAEAIAEPEEARAILSPAKARQDVQKPRVTNAAPSDGMRIARSAAGKLNEIRPDDRERSEAFAYMRNWLDAHEA